MTLPVEATVYSLQDTDIYVILVPSQYTLQLQKYVLVIRPDSAECWLYDIYGEGQVFVLPRNLTGSEGVVFIAPEKQLIIGEGSQPSVFVFKRYGGILFVPSPV